MFPKIDPENIIRQERDEIELQVFLLFCVSVAGKTASQIAKALDVFFSIGSKLIPDETFTTPFELIDRLYCHGLLKTAIMQSKLGQHKKLFKLFSDLAYSDLNFKEVTPDELESFNGIGPKTSRFFIVYTQPDARYAILDTHILKFLQEEYPALKIPKVTPPSRKYREIEKIYLDYIEKNRLSIQEHDLSEWIKRSKKKV